MSKQDKYEDIIRQSRDAYHDLAADICRRDEISEDIKIGNAKVNQKVREARKLLVADIAAAITEKTEDTPGISITEFIHSFPVHDKQHLSGEMESWVQLRIDRAPAGHVYHIGFEKLPFINDFRQPDIIAGGTEYMYVFKQVGGDPPVFVTRGTVYDEREANRIISRTLAGLEDAMAQIAKQKVVSLDAFRTVPRRAIS